MVAGGAQQSQVLPLERVDALSISELYDEVEQALARVFPRGRQLWVRGEVQSLSDRTGHCYIDLVDPETVGERQVPVLRVKCWESTWRPLRADLAREGIELQAGMVVVLRGTLDFYRPRAEVGFILAEVDVTALLGRLAAERAALLRRLESEGLLERNRAVPVPDVPVRVGLVASPGTEGFRDFLGQLEASGFAFSVRVVPVTVQGPSAPAALAEAIGRPGAARAVGQARGHCAPVAAYNERQDVVPLLDPRGSYHRAGLPLASLDEAMNTIDAVSGARRGSLQVNRCPASGERAVGELCVWLSATSASATPGTSSGSRPT